MNHTAECILYVVLYFFPFMLFAYYPLRYFKRFKATTLIALELAFAVVEIIFFLLGMRHFSEYIAIFIIFIVVFNIAAYKLLYKIGLGRILFNLLLIVNMANFIVVFSTYLNLVLFRDSVDLTFYWRDSICLIISELVFLLPMFLFVKHFSDSMIRNSAYDYIWNLAWILPLLLSFLGGLLIYTPTIMATSEIELYQKKSIICAMNAVALLLTYFIVAKLISGNHSILKLENELHYRSIQQLQYYRMEQQIKDTRIIRHDLRHHMAMMSHYVETEEYDKLKDYLSKYSQSIDQLSQLHYTDNTPLNALLVHCATMCKTSHIPFEANVALPDTMPLQDSEITILFGNLLENAYHACLEVDEGSPRHISVQASSRANINLFVIENSYSNNLKQDGTGNYMTTKADGSGLGILSAKEIVLKHDGHIEFKPSEDVFSVSFSLPAKAT